MHCIFHVTSVVARLELGSQHSNEDRPAPSNLWEAIELIKSISRTDVVLVFKEVPSDRMRSDKAIQRRGLSGIEGSSEQASARGKRR